MRKSSSSFNSRLDAAIDFYKYQDYSPNKLFFNNHIGENVLAKNIDTTDCKINTSSHCMAYKICSWGVYKHLFNSSSSQDNQSNCPVSHCSELA